VALVDILIPTYGRKTGLAVVLTSLIGQTFSDFNVIISDQTKEEEIYLESIEIQTLVQDLRWQGHEMVLHRHLPQRGLAEHRQFLLLRKYGGCGILPSGTYHLGLPTTIEDRRHNATELFEELVQECKVHPSIPIGVET
jgi:hypothetical protein